MDDQRDVEVDDAAATPVPAAVSPAGPGRPRTWAILAAAAAVIALGIFGLTKVVGGDDDSDAPSTAQLACEKIMEPGVTEAEVAGLVSAALEDGVLPSVSREECGEVVDEVLDQLGVGPLADEVAATPGVCDNDRMTGRVTNNSGTTVDVAIRYELFEFTYQLVKDGRVFLEAIEPGETVEWKDSFPDTSYRRCRVVIETVRAN